MADSDEALARQNLALTRQMLEWIASTPRTYADTVETWRSSCPRHTIWEDAVMAGLVDHDGSGSSIIRLTERGRALLRG